ncbi:MAG: DUF6273 domain-containing protein [Clostridia bacterium]
MPQLPAYALASRALLESIDGSLQNIAASQALRAAAGAADYQDIQNLIRRGLGKKGLPMGTQTKATHGVYGELIADVLDHDIDLDPLARVPHSTTFLLHALLEGTQFDAPEAFYYAEAELAAGTYNFILATAYGGWAAGTYQFTTTQALPAGGQFTLSGYETTAMTATMVFAFASRTTTTKTEGCVITAGSGGTNLGTFGTTLNHAQRVSYGYNNWEQSAIRQWLNSSAAANAWWAPQNNYDRPPTYLSRPGFFGGLPADLRAVIGETDHKVALNTVTDGGGAATVRDKIFLLSQEEVYGTGENSQDEGTQYEYFKNLTNAQRVKYLANGTPTYWWLRSPYSGSAYRVRVVDSTGALNSYGAVNGSGVAAAWTIY